VFDLSDISLDLDAPAPAVEEPTPSVSGVTSSGFGDSRMPDLDMDDVDDDPLSRKLELAENSADRRHRRRTRPAARGRGQVQWFGEEPRAEHAGRPRVKPHRHSRFARCRPRSEVDREGGAGRGLSGAAYQGCRVSRVADGSGQLERALSQFADAPLRTLCAGRTDTGVHALNQVVHLDTEISRAESSWCAGQPVLAAGHRGACVA